MAGDLESFCGQRLYRSPSHESYTVRRIRVIGADRKRGLETVEVQYWFRVSVEILQTVIESENDNLVRITPMN